MLNIIFFAGFWFYNINPDFVKGVLAFFVFRWLYFYNYEEAWAWIYALKINKRVRELKEQNPIKLKEGNGTEDI
jgi:hypothetical protein